MSRKNALLILVVLALGAMWFFALFSHEPYHQVEKPKMVVAQDEKTGEEYAAPVKQDLNGRHYLAGVPKKIK